MKTFKVFKHHVLGFQAVKVGFSWPGFLFCVIWLLIKKLWGHALMIISIFILLTLLHTVFENEQSHAMLLLLEISVYIFVGFNGNKWRVTNLQERGFKLIDTVQAETPNAAIGKVVNV